MVATSTDRSNYWLTEMGKFAETFEEPYRARYAALAAEETGVKIAYWRSDAAGLPIFGGNRKDTEPARPGLIQIVTGPLEICSAAGLHATMNPALWRGARLWLVAMFGAIVEDEKVTKMAALKREFLGEITASL